MSNGRLGIYIVFYGVLLVDLLQNYIFLWRLIFGVIKVFAESTYVT